MIDIALLLLLVLGFVAAVGYVGFCERLVVQQAAMDEAP